MIQPCRLAHPQKGLSIDRRWIGDVGKGAHRVSSCLPYPFSAHRQAVGALILGQAGDRHADKGDDGDHLSDRANGHVSDHVSDRGHDCGRDHSYAAGRSWQDDMPRCRNDHKARNLQRYFPGRKRLFPRHDGDGFPAPTQPLLQSPEPAPDIYTWRNSYCCFHAEFPTLYQQRWQSPLGGHLDLSLIHI